MAALGHDPFDVVGHDIGTWTGYALAADHPERVGRLAVVEAVIPGLTPSPPVFSPAAVNQKLWQFGFNRLTEELVRRRERLFFGWQFATKAATPATIPAYAVDVHVDAIAADPRALRASFAYYPALDETIAQNGQRSRTRLTLPVLAVGGALWGGANAAQTMRLAASPGWSSATAATIRQKSSRRGSPRSWRTSSVANRWQACRTADTFAAEFRHLCLRPAPSRCGASRAPRVGGARGRMSTSTDGCRDDHCAALPVTSARATAATPQSKVDEALRPARGAITGQVMAGWRPCPGCTLWITIRFGL